MARVYLESLTKVFEGKVIAVDELTLEIPDKGLVSLLGPSGCGKTTTMRMIAGLEIPTKGKIYFDGQDVTHLPPEERNVAMVFQFPVIYPGMTVFENIAFPLVARKTPKNEIRKRVEEVADVFGVTDVLSKKAHLLDAGTKQKVVLARTFVRRPHVYLLDEPLTSVDPSTRVELRTILKKLQSQLGQTMVYVTHDQSEALTLADRIAVMNEGKLLQYGSPEEVYNNPKNTFVGYFLGNPGMNFIGCSVDEEKGSCVLNAEDFKVFLPDLPVSLLRSLVGKKVVLGIRPENLEISMKPILGAISFSVILVEPIGNRLVIHLKRGEKVLKAKIPRQEIVLQQEVWVRFPLEFLKFFDGETLEAIEI
ncbi:MAG: ABC transporter ATP-binding protein [Candidatus Caldatribacterium sp.]|uniref:ABC transporter ATP-binding protein n=1 Tax=Candidatus Caldatribacterium sp. TaxID=2282143 RepID=UPI00299C4193|nr:ABC transporter ATP-binding protein [Candidatus Caldatribacterium sp.]MCX7729768.1 ABC transporter ATP-binding protein [Candidatus Caldatribacterium sp.]MDW8081810.1 ABC transporter ATP-binding protein [Candidatus Calescibacterium sp.]